MIFIFLFSVKLSCKTINNNEIHNNIYSKIYSDKITNPDKSYIYYIFSKGQIHINSIIFFIIILIIFIFFIFYRIKIVKNKSYNKLKNIRNLFFNFANNSNLLVFRWLVNEGRYEYLSDACFSITGYEPDDFYHNPGLIFEIMHPDSKSYFIDINNDLSNGICAEKYEFKIIDKTGKSRWLSQINVLGKDKRGNPKFLEGIVSDITLQKKSEKVKYNMNRFFNSIIENEGVLITVLNCKNEFIFWNKGAEKILGYTQSEVINNKNILNFLYPDKEYKQYVDSIRNEVIYGKQVNDLRLKVKNKFGKDKNISLYSKVLLDEDGVPDGLVNIAIDITEQVKIQDENVKLIEKLSVALEKSEETNRLKKEFLDLMSHEIRTPLTGILGFSNLTLNYIKTEEFNTLKDKIKRNSEYVYKSAQRLNRMLSNLLELSVIESGIKKEIIFKELNIRNIIEDIYIMFTDKLENASLNFNIDIKCEDNIFSDEIRINHILFNLIANAIKFTDQGEIKVTLTREDDCYLFCVSDTGIGIKPEDQEQIFHTFKQADSNTNKRRYQGVGLGLSICKKLVENINGKIWIESELGQGSKFYFSIPYKPPLDIFTGQ